MSDPADPLVHQRDMHAGNRCACEIDPPAVDYGCQLADEVERLRDALLGIISAAVPAGRRSEQAGWWQENDRLKDEILSLLWPTRP